MFQRLYYRFQNDGFPRFFSMKIYIFFVFFMYFLCFFIYFLCFLCIFLCFFHNFCNFCVYMSRNWKKDDKKTQKYMENMRIYMISCDFVCKKEVVISIWFCIVMFCAHKNNTFKNQCDISLAFYKQNRMKSYKFKLFFMYFCVFWSSLFQFLGMFSQKLQKMWKKKHKQIHKKTQKIYKKHKKNT